MKKSEILIAKISIVPTATSVKVSSDIEVVCCVLPKVDVKRKGALKAFFDKPVIEYLTAFFFNWRLCGGAVR